MPSALQYPYAAVRSLLTYTPTSFTVTVDGVPHVQDAFSVVVANSGYYGSGMHIAPMADVHDGLLDVVVLPAQSRLRMVRNLNKVYDGRHIDLPDASVDRIFCLDAFHHVPDQRSILAEMGRILRTGGIAGFVEPGPAHSKDPSSQLEMRNFKVIENDIVLENILTMGRAAGFTEMKVSVGSTYPPRVSLERYRGFPSDAQLVHEYLDSTADRIHRYPIFFLHKGHAPIDDSRDMAGLVADIDVARSITTRRGSPIVLHACFHNASPKRWLPSGAKPGSVNIGYFVHQVTTGGHSGRGSEYRAHLSDSVVEPGATARATIDLGALEPGRYRVDIDLVSEHVRWFQANGSKIACVDIVVE